MTDTPQAPAEGLAEERRLLTDLIELQSGPSHLYPEYARQLKVIEDSADLADRVQEAALVGAAADFRQELRRRAWGRVSGIQASPPTGSRFELREGVTLDYGYERGLPMTPLEERASSLAGHQNETRPEAVIFSSGMAALGATLESLVYQFFQDHGRRPRVAVLAEYFETSMLLELLTPTSESIARPASVEQLADLDADIVVIEPVRYDWDLSVADLPRLCSEWSSRGRFPSYVVTDSTLCPLFWPLTTLRRLVDSGCGTRVVDVRSGLKLDQQGLELSNLGLATVFASSQTETDSLAEFLRGARAVRGGGLSLGNLLVLEAPFVFDSARLTGHVTRIYRNNAQFARSVQRPAGLFSSIAHPLLSDATGFPGVAPFTVLQLEEGSLDDYRLLVGVIDREASRRGLQLDFGSSFGFRSHRYETIVPRKSTLRCLLKVAMGSRRGPSSEGITHLFQELSEISDVGELHRRFPNATPARLVV